MTARFRFTLLAIGFLVYPQLALSLGLGDARVQSFIGQPLELRIDLLTSPGDDLDSVTARLASAEDFALIGASREAIGMPLSFSVREARDGSGAYILATSRLAVNDPVLRLVVEVNWSSGRLLREYTVFLDPPTVPARAPEPATARSESRPQPSGDPQSEPAETPSERVFTDRPPPPGQPAERATAPAPAQTDDVPAESVAQSARAPAEPDRADDISSDGQYGPVQSGETLWRIATNYVGQSGMDMNQVMMAIQRRNPEAFVNENINLLKRGATLDMPSAAEVSQISSEQARELVAQHEAAFRMRSSLASTSTPLLAAESRADTPRPTPAPVIEEPADPGVSRLEIVPASEEDLSAGQAGTGAVPGGEGSEEVERSLREELARTEEELFSERQQNEYLRERIDELEAQLGQGDDLADDFSDGLVPDDELAEMEDRLQADRLAEAEAADEPAPAEEIEEQQSGTMPSVTTTTPAEQGKPWYSGPVIWVIMVVIVIAAVIGWIFNRRRGEEYDLSAMAEGGTVATGLRGEAEEILRTLDADQRQDEAEEPDEPRQRGFSAYDDDGDDEDEPETREADEAEPPLVPLARNRRSSHDGTGDARVLDESSSDPEIKLDLARAYISMGDKEAARAILDEVLTIGNEEQCAEAQAMMDDL